jgi:hypothetical protein
MGGACSMYGGEDRCLQSFGGENLRESDHLEDPGVDGRLLLRWIFRNWNVDWIELAQDSERYICECGYEPSGSMR